VKLLSRKIASTLGLHVLDHQRDRLRYRSRVRVVGEIFDELTGEAVVSSENEEELKRLYQSLTSKTP